MFGVPSILVQPLFSDEQKLLIEDEVKKKAKLRFVLVLAAAFVVFFVVRKWRR